MSTMASQITSLTIVYSIVYSGADQRKLQSSALLAFVWGIHRWQLNSRAKGQSVVARKMFLSDDVIMDKCLICTRKLLQHAYNISCSLRSETYLLKCVSIIPEDLEYIELHRNDWYCSCCLVDLCPFNNLENETDFMSTINDSPAIGFLRYLSDKMFLPFEVDDSDHQYGNESIDPDLNYFRSFNQYISCCNYFAESPFNSEIDNVWTWNNIFLCVI